MDNNERRDNGKVYISDEAVFEKQKSARQLTYQMNAMDTSDFAGIAEVARKLFGKCGKNIMVNPPFRCDYGTNIEIGDNFFCNYNCVMLDCNKIKIGNNCLFAPNVSIYAAGNPCKVIRKITDDDIEFYFKKDRFDEEAFMDMERIWNENPDSKKFPFKDREKLSIIIKRIKEMFSNG